MPIELSGGPLDGDLHELHGQLKPAKIGLVLNGQRHWYIVERASETAKYEHSEACKIDAAYETHRSEFARLEAKLERELGRTPTTAEIVEAFDLEGRT